MVLQILVYASVQCDVIQTDQARLQERVQNKSDRTREETERDSETDTGKEHSRKRARAHKHAQTHSHNRTHWVFKNSRKYYIFVFIYLFIYLGCLGETPGIKIIARVFFSFSFVLATFHKRNQPNLANWYNICYWHNIIISPNNKVSLSKKKKSAGCATQCIFESTFSFNHCTNL